MNRPLFQVTMRMESSGASTCAATGSAAVPPMTLSSNITFAIATFAIQ